MAKKDKKLVVEHLENVSWKVLDAYPEVVSALIKRRSGVYTLYRKSQLYYVGLASNLMVRLKAHLRDRHSGLWDRFSVYLTVHDEHMKEMESLLLRIGKPTGNKVSGKFMDSVSLRGQLNQAIKNDADDERARLMGGAVARRRRKAKARKSKGRLLLGDLVDRRTPLRAWRGDYEYFATALKDGTIEFDGIKPRWSLQNRPKGVTAKPANGDGPGR